MTITNDDELQFLNGPSKSSKNPAGVQTRQTSRLHKVKHESQCVTLCGGDYGNFSQVKKKLKHDKVLESKDSSFPQSVVKQGLKINMKKNHSVLLEFAYSFYF